MFHYSTLYYVYVRLFRSAVVAAALAPVTLLIVARFSVTVFQYCTIFMLYYLMVHYFNDALAVVELFNVALFDVVLFDAALFNVALFTVAVFL